MGVGEEKLGGPEVGVGHVEAAVGGGAGWGGAQVR